MKFSQIGFVLLCALLRIVPLFAQDSLVVKGKLNDTLMLSNATVTARSQEQQLREGAYAVSAVNIRLQAATLLRRMSICAALPFFAWLQMLDMNVVIILTLMMIVAAFTLISAMLMIVLERIRVIGNFKALGATNGSIRRIFIYLTGKLIIKALIIGNVIGIGLALLQKYGHIVRLDPTAYYMPYVPIHLSIPALLMLNVGIIIVSYLTLLGASHIISTIKPTATMRFE